MEEEFNPQNYFETSAIEDKNVRLFALNYADYLHNIVFLLLDYYDQGRFFPRSTFLTDTGQRVLMFYSPSMTTLRRYLQDNEDKIDFTMVSSFVKWFIKKLVPVIYSVSSGKRRCKKTHQLVSSIDMHRFNRRFRSKNNSNYFCCLINTFMSVFFREEEICDMIDDRRETDISFLSPSCPLKLKVSLREAKTAIFEDEG